jgi:hypothetical protein
MLSSLPKAATIYIVVITIAWIVIFYAFLRQCAVMKKNKFKYDLQTIRFEVEPLGDEAWKLNFYCGGIPLHSEVVSEIDVFNDKAFFYKAFVKWCEEETK